MDRIEVTAFQQGQEESVARIHNAAFAEWIRKLESCYSYRTLTPQDVLDWNKKPSHSIWLAYVDGDAAGYASCHSEVVRGKRDFLLLYFDPTPPNWGQSRIAVVPQHRRKGVATALMQAILEDFEAKGGELVHAAAYDDNAAASALLSKVGFTHSELFYFEPYSDREPWGYDTLYAEVDLTKPLKDIHLNPDVTIRAPHADDLDAFVRIFRESAPFAFGPDPSYQQITTWLTNPNSEAILVAEYDGKAVGVMEFFRNGVIGIPGVLPEYRNRGIGTTLFHHLLKRMQLNGHRKAIGDTGLIQESMIRMYRRFGFHVSRKLWNWTKVMRMIEG